MCLGDQLSTILPSFLREYIDILVIGSLNLGARRRKHIYKS